MATSGEMQNLHTQRSRVFW